MYMKVKIKQVVFNTALFFVGFFILESCSQESMYENNFDTTENVEEATSRSTDYCRYRVVDPFGETPPWLQEDDIVCLPCNEPCQKWIDYEVLDQNGNVIARFIGRALSPSCDVCPSGSAIIP